jgi:DegV family protein with EDD domain
MVEMNHQRVALITDSGCDLPQELLARYDICMVPLYIIWDGEELRDRVDIGPRAFYERLAASASLPTTSQPTPQDFANAYRAAKADGAQDVIVMTISSGMSSTCDAARQAAQMVDFPVTVVDTKANSMSEGWQVLAAARAREAGGGTAEMLAAAEAVRRREVTLLMVDTLDYLHRGGRIGRAAHWVGSMLDLKPQLYVDHATGKIEPGARTRTRKKAVEALYRSFFEQVGSDGPLRVAVLHGHCQGDAEALAERIRRERSPEEVVVTLTSPVMGVHTGPGALALCGYREVVSG